MYCISGAWLILNKDDKQELGFITCIFQQEFNAEAEATDFTVIS